MSAPEDLDRPALAVPAGTAADPAPDPYTTAGSVATAGLPSAAAVARYALGEEIGQGGMGVVYRATDTVLGREVAVKVLSEKFGLDSAAARRFADEARITGQLQHPA